MRYLSSLINSIKSYKKYFLSQIKMSTKDPSCEDADQLISTYGTLAYTEARTLARQARLRSNYSDEKKWSRVARQIARLENRTIGLDNATRRLMD